MKVKWYFLGPLHNYRDTKTYCQNDVHFKKWLSKKRERKKTNREAYTLGDGRSELKTMFWEDTLFSEKRVTKVLIEKKRSKTLKLILHRSTLTET